MLYTLFVNGTTFIKCLPTPYITANSREKYFKYSLGINISVFRSAMLTNEPRSIPYILKDSRGVFIELLETTTAHRYTRSVYFGLVEGLILSDWLEIRTKNPLICAYIRVGIWTV